jgi:hypothetical protein
VGYEVKVFVNQEGELAIGELAFVFSDESYLWYLYNGHENFWSPQHPHKWGWKYIGELDG